MKIERSGEEFNIGHSENKAKISRAVCSQTVDFEPAEVNIDNKKYIIWDSPGFFDTKGSELDLYFKVGFYSIL